MLRTRLLQQCLIRESGLALRSKACYDRGGVVRRAGGVERGGAGRAGEGAWGIIKEQRRGRSPSGHSGRTTG
ncbi:hypothetical protein E2C01_024676 [Portunus trituberculatus]|uniref:Uncharacterized protein n=1 Tax=Portunus trituberculatus TaxID=210409 RepID=A0A5B7ED03_PORTR|nr:hypothetical protein [Portunus trituberculatus]